MSSKTAGSAGKVLGGIAAVAIAGSAFLDWVDIGRGSRGTRSGTDIPVQFLVDKEKFLDSGPSLLLLLGIAAALVAMGVFLARAHRFSTLAGAILAIVVVVLYCAQVQRGLDSSDSPLDLTDFIAIGTYVALIGGLAALIAAFMPSGHADDGAPAAAPASEAAPTPPPAAPTPPPEPVEPVTPAAPPADAAPESVPDSAPEA